MVSNRTAKILILFIVISVGQAFANNDIDTNLQQIIQAGIDKESIFQNYKKINVKEAHALYGKIVEGTIDCNKYRLNKSEFDNLFMYIMLMTSDKNDMFSTIESPVICLANGIDDYGHAEAFSNYAVQLINGNMTQFKILYDSLFRRYVPADTKHFGFLELSIFFCDKEKYQYLLKSGQMLNSSIWNSDQQINAFINKFCPEIKIKGSDSIEK